VSVETQDLLLFAVALLTAAGSAVFYVLAVLDEDRPLSRASALAFVVFGAVAAVMFFWRVL
jgi:NADH:ubiquinone oxidoreductase subunit 2 (subunit N)